MNRSSRRMAVSSMMVALGTAVMLLGGAIPVATFCCPAVAGLVLLPLVFDCTRAHALSAWAAIGLLSLMLCPDKEAALLFVFLGWYPVMKWWIDARLRRRWLRRALKLVMWNAALAAMYAIIFYVLRLDQVLADYQSMTRAMAVAMAVLGNLTLALYDIVLVRFAALYIRRIRPKLFGRAG
ncbi:MAG: hypothetical protein IJJ45_09390 [Clostridia bacterium]|nr:hypothetical protein [Clostridia bacterium]